MRRGSPLIYPACLTIRVGRPIATADLSVDDRDALIQRVRAAITELLSSTGGDRLYEPV